MQSPAQSRTLTKTQVLPTPQAAATRAKTSHRPRAAHLVMVLAGLAIAGCTRVPELEDRLTPDLRGSEYPALVPLEDALQPSARPAEESKALEDNLTARAARLQARAEALRNAQP
ncbi:hypothetical protein [Phaeobacter porticola]|uniref:Uncharacterized protein n=1 Tax=Phaeobacter porticola TaxID=1844006 RepID=A0A1L3I2C6_9RHOB|nr:hypothetical protein [Phaeobacter porticola]APG46264.1 hypothetical protein PhaeoP97_00830 [Phaeobacter porticola]